MSEPTKLLPIIVDIFISVIEKEGGKHAFESAFRNSTTTSIDFEKLKQINDIPCLIIWGKKDILIPLTYADIFKKVLSSARFELILDAGHSPFIEKTAITYEKIRAFMLKNHFNSDNHLHVDK